MTQRAQFEKSYEQQRMFAALGGFFGVLAALLVATGLYGTYSFRASWRLRRNWFADGSRCHSCSQVLTTITRAAAFWYSRSASRQAFLYPCSRCVP